MLMNQSFGMSSGVWDVLQIAPTTRPGEFTLWLAINSTFQSIKLRVPREFYVNLKKRPARDTFDPAYKAEQVVRTLPRGHPVQHLYRITVDERTFVEGEAHFSSLINNPNVDGAYELRVPLSVRALMQFGSSCRLTKDTGGGLSRGLDKGFDLEELEPVGANITRHQYLNQGAGLRYIYLHHSSSGPRHVYMLCIPGRDVKVYVVDAARNRAQMPNASKWYLEEKSKLSENELANGLFEYPDTLEVATTYFGTETAAMRVISKELAAHRRGPNMIVLRSPLDKEHLAVKASIFADFPIVTAGQPSDKGASPLMWLVSAAKAFVTDFLSMSSWLARQIDLASHYDVPLGVSFDIHSAGCVLEMTDRTIRDRRICRPMWHCL